MSLWEKIVLHKNKIFAILFCVGVFYWITIPEEDDDPYIIYIEYDCRTVYKDAFNIPKEVIDQCNHILDEQNGSKTRKYST